jgi:hypothetical protein
VTFEIKQKFNVKINDLLQFVVIMKIDDDTFVETY